MWANSHYGLSAATYYFVYFVVYRIKKQKKEKIPSKLSPLMFPREIPCMDPLWCRNRIADRIPPDQLFAKCNKAHQLPPPVHDAAPEAGEASTLHNVSLLEDNSLGILSCRKERRRQVGEPDEEDDTDDDTYNDTSEARVGLETILEETAVSLAVFRELILGLSLKSESMALQSRNLVGVNPLHLLVTHFCLFIEKRGHLPIPPEEHFKSSPDSSSRDENDPS